MAIKLRKGAVSHVIKTKKKAGKSITAAQAKKIAEKKTLRDKTQGRGEYQKFDFAGDGKGKSDPEKQVGKAPGPTRDLGKFGKTQKYKAGTTPKYSGKFTGDKGKADTIDLSKINIGGSKATASTAKSGGMTDAEVSAGRKSKMSKDVNDPVLIEKRRQGNSSIPVTKKKYHNGQTTPKTKKVKYKNQKGSTGSVRGVSKTQMKAM